MRVLLIQPPFWAVNSPSIGLSYLRGALRAAGLEADILYSNLDFAARIGRDVYGVVQAQLPVDLLFGDLVFGPALQGGDIPGEAVRDLLEKALAKHAITRSVPEGVLDRYVELAEQAIRFVEAFRAARPWQGYDLVGFTTTFSLVPALALGKALKSTPGAPPVVFGGCHCEGSLGEALMGHFPWIDFAARGDGEGLIVSLARHLQTPQLPLRSVAGLLWREGEHLGRADQDRARTEDLDALPVPEFQDWLERLEELGWKELNTLRLPIETSRGCWYGQKHQCTFCGLNGASLDFRTKGADRILEEYSALMVHGIPVIYGVDSVLDPTFFRTVIPRLEALPQKAVMFFEVRATHSRAQLLALRNAGIRVLQPGIESLDTRLLQLMNKGTTAFQNVRMLRWAAELSLPVSWNLLCGLPGEEAEDYIRMAELVPSLTHLLPPITGCNPVHVDRFSPLFDSYTDIVKPLSPYAVALGLEPTAVRELAYHFEFNNAIPASPRDRAALEALQRVVHGWLSVAGSAAFVRIDLGQRIRLCDTRPGAINEEILLEGIRADAYRMMEEGCDRERLARDLRLDACELDDLIGSFLEQRWIVELDEKCLGLAVTVDGEVAEDAPQELQGSLATALYHHRMAQLWKVVGS